MPNKYASFFIALVFTMAAVTIVFAQEPNDTACSEMKFIFPLKKWKEKRNIDTLSLIDFYEMSLDELDSLKTVGVSTEMEEFINSLMTVSTQTSLTTITNPSIVTLITEEEIQNSGARDLIDVLRLVPGFHFSLDEFGKVGLGIRGNWANEGKVLLNIDGQEINEHYTSRVYFGNHYPVDIIKKIEIIRGPGSAIYGGFAEYGVINIITKNGKEDSGISAGVTYGSNLKQLFRQNYHLYSAKDWKKLGYSFYASGGVAQRGDGQHYSFYDHDAYPNSAYDTLGVGDYISLKNQSEIDHFTTNSSIYYDKLQVRHILDMYRSTDVTVINEGGEPFRKLGLLSNFFEAKYKLDITDRISVEPKINCNIHSPWETGTLYALNKRDKSLPDSLKGSSTVRIREGLKINWDLTHRINLTIGSDVYTDMAKVRDTTSVFYIDDSQVTYTNVAAYAQSIFLLPHINIIAGLRYEANTRYEPSIVPRIGFTKKINKFHFKLLFNNAFRAPTIGNLYRSLESYTVDADTSRILDVEKELDPERSFFGEAELGFQFDENTLLKCNFFYIRSSNTIAYHYYVDSITEMLPGYEYGFRVYQNFNHSGSKGAEIELQNRGKWGYVNLNYSFYSVRNMPLITPYEVSTFDFNPNNRDLFLSNFILGFPKHKINLNVCANITNNLTANLTSTFYGKRYAYDILLKGDIVDENGSIILPAKYNVSGMLVEKPRKIAANIYFNYKNLFTEGLHLGIGCYNIFNSRYEYVQPYFGLNTPLQSNSRELVVKLSYNFPL